MVKLSKKLLATQVNSVRPYKSRSKRPCDFCRRRKTCCIIEKSIPCMACSQFNKGDCTFLEKPLKRGKRNPPSDRYKKTSKILKQDHESDNSFDYESSSSVVQASPNLTFPLELRNDQTTGDLSYNESPAHPIYPSSSSSWQQVMDTFRSQSTGDIYPQQVGGPQAYNRDLFYPQTLDQVSYFFSDNQGTNNEFVEEFKDLRQVKYNYNQSPVSSVRQTSLPQERDLDHIQYMYGNQDQDHIETNNYQHYGEIAESQPQLDNSEFMSSLNGSSSSSRLGTVLWSPQTLDGSVMEEPSTTDFECSIGSKVFQPQHAQIFSSGAQPVHYCQEAYNSFNNGSVFGGNGFVGPMGSAHYHTQTQ